MPLFSRRHLPPPPHLGQSAPRRHIHHLPPKHPIPLRPRLQRSPITSPRHQRPMQPHNLVLHNLHAAPKIIRRLQNRPLRIFNRQPPIPRPIKITPVPPRIFILQLQQTLLSRRPMRHRINRVHRRLQMMHIAHRIQPRLRRRQRLKRIRPELPPLHQRLLTKSRTIPPHRPRRPLAQQTRRQILLDNHIPPRLPRRPTQLCLLLIQRRRRSQLHHRFRRRPLHRLRLLTPAPSQRQHRASTNHNHPTSHPAHLLPFAERAKLYKLSLMSDAISPTQRTQNLNTPAAPYT